MYTKHFLCNGKVLLYDRSSIKTFGKIKILNKKKRKILYQCTVLMILDVFCKMEIKRKEKLKFRSKRWFLADL